MLFKQHIPRYSFELQQDPLRKLGTQIIEPFSENLEFREIETCKPGVFLHTHAKTNIKAH